MKFHLDEQGLVHDWLETPHKDIEAAILPLVSTGCDVFYKDDESIRRLGRNPRYPFEEDSLSDNLCGYASARRNWENRMTKHAIQTYIQSHPTASREGQEARTYFLARIGEKPSPSRHDASR